MMKSTTDKIQLEKNADLVAKIAAGDRQAFSQFVLQNQRQVVNLAFRILGDRSAAEDIAQDAFLRAYIIRPIASGAKPACRPGSIALR
ncbi:MAG: sigma factor [candidate division KSB1 bacterium]|nr:sigma factor [candidate division KSB1 bacterium]